MDKLAILVNKPQLDLIAVELPKYACGKWHYTGRRLEFEYHGNPKALLIIPYGEDTWRTGYLEFGGMTTIKAVDKEYLTTSERHAVLESFVLEVLNKYCNDHIDIKLVVE